MIRAAFNHEVHIWQEADGTGLVDPCNAQVQSKACANKITRSDEYD